MMGVSDTAPYETVVVTEIEDGGMRRAIRSHLKCVQERGMVVVSYPPQVTDPENAEVEHVMCETCHGPLWRPTDG